MQTEGERSHEDDEPLRRHHARDLPNELAGPRRVLQDLDAENRVETRWFEWEPVSVVEHVGGSAAREGVRLPIGCRVLHADILANVRLKEVGVRLVAASDIEEPPARTRSYAPERIERERPLQV